MCFFSEADVLTHTTAAMGSRHWEVANIAGDGDHTDAKDKDDPNASDPNAKAQAKTGALDAN